VLSAPSIPPQFTFLPVSMSNITPGDNDILLGKKNRTHIGNRSFRNFVSYFAPLYNNAGSLHVKRSVMEAIYKITTGTSGSRFLEYEDGRGWFTPAYDKCISKIRRTLWKCLEGCKKPACHPPPYEPPPPSLPITSQEVISHAPHLGVLCCPNYIQNNPCLHDSVRSVQDYLYSHPTHHPQEPGPGIALSADSAYGNPVRISSTAKPYLRQYFGRQVLPTHNSDEVIVASYASGSGKSSTGTPAS